MNTIPKKIHQIWIGGEIQPIIAIYTSTFKNIKGFEYKLWGNSDLKKANFPKTWKYISNLMSREKPIWAQITDLMRLEILHRHGGIYVDSTMEYIGKKNSLEKMIETTSKFIMSNESDCGLKCGNGHGELYISNSFIASVPKYKVLTRLLSNKYLSKIDLDKPANKSTGPYYVRTGILDKDDVKMLPINLIYPFNYDTEDSQDPCISETSKRQFIKTSYFKQDWYIKVPCNAYKDAIMIKHWDIGGSWIKKNSVSKNIQ